MAEPIRPEFILDDTISEHDRVALDGLQQMIREHPDFAQKSLDLYAQSPDVVSNVVQFLQEHPEGGMRMLSAWHSIMEDKLDLDFSFDDGTETAIANDPYYKSVSSEYQKTGDIALQSKARKRRWGIFITRAATAA